MNFQNILMKPYQLENGAMKKQIHLKEFICT